jgi:thiosulfate dehydrogenase [quinone] large subunit
MLVILRTLVGWHFLYEGYTKLLHPAWGQNGVPLPPWSSAGYLKAARGPLAPLFHWMGDASWIGSLDLLLAVTLAAVGLSLMLGLFTQIGCGGAVALLAAFYLAAVPTGALDVRAEGTYLLVNKNLIEACAVLVLFTFRTGLIAGLDRWWMRSPSATVSTREVAV